MAHAAGPRFDYELIAKALGCAPDAVKRRLWPPTQEAPTRVFKLDGAYYCCPARGRRPPRDPLRLGLPWAWTPFSGQTGRTVWQATRGDADRRAEAEQQAAVADLGALGVVVEHAVSSAGWLARRQDGDPDDVVCCATLAEALAAGAALAPQGALDALVARLGQAVRGMKKTS